MKRSKENIQKMVDTQKKRRHPWRRPFNMGHLSKFRKELNPYKI